MTEDAALHAVLGLWREMAAQIGDQGGTFAAKRSAYRDLTRRLTGPGDTPVAQVDAFGTPCLLVGGPSRDLLVHVHGGGFVMGSADGYTGFGAELARRADAQVLLVDYRLAPEHPCPSAVDDVARAYRWATDAVEPGGGVAISGDSAGGAVALGGLMLALDEGLPAPSALVAMSPLVDLALTGRTMARMTDPVVSRASMAAHIALYLDGADPATTPYASPLHAATMPLIPASLVLVGHDEILHDDAVRLAAALRAAGGESTLVVGEHMPHIWPFFWSALPQGATALAMIAAFLRDTWDRERSGRRAEPIDPPHHGS